jgi:hypothetical protein
MAVMKKISIIALLALTLMLSGCTKTTKKDLYSQIIGEWELVGYSTKSVTVGDQKVSVSVSFSSYQTTNAFVMYQTVGDSYIKQYSGTWDLTDNVLSGKYSDGTAWGNTYSVSISDDGNTLIMETTVGTAELYTYKRVE